MRSMVEGAREPKAMGGMDTISIISFTSKLMGRMDTLNFLNFTHRSGAEGEGELLPPEPQNVESDGPNGNRQLHDLYREGKGRMATMTFITFTRRSSRSERRRIARPARLDGEGEGQMATVNFMTFTAKVRAEWQPLPSLLSPPKAWLAGRRHIVLFAAVFPRVGSTDETRRECLLRQLYRPTSTSPRICRRRSPGVAPKRARKQRLK